MDRRDLLKATLAVLWPSRLLAAAPEVSSLIGNGSPGLSDGQVNNPYGLAIGLDRALYFCDLDNQRIRRLELRTRRTPGRPARTRRCARPLRHPSPCPQ
jgi:hypothetical protein